MSSKFLKLFLVFLFGSTLGATGMFLVHRDSYRRSHLKHIAQLELVRTIMMYDRERDPTRKLRYADEAFRLLQTSEVTDNRVILKNRGPMPTDGK